MIKKFENRIIRMLECRRCGWRWVSYREKGPKNCPKCKSPYWDKPYVRKDFINRINQKGFSSRKDFINRIVEIAEEAWQNQEQDVDEQSINKKS